MKSLRARLNLVFVLPTALIVVVLVVVVYLAGRQGLEDELDRRLEAVAQVLAVDMSEGIDAAQIGRLDESMQRVRQRLQDRLVDVEATTDVKRIFIFDDQSGRLVDTDEQAAFGETLYRVQTDRGEVQTAFEDRIATSGPLYRTDDGMFHKTAYAPIVYEGQTVAVIGVEASADYFDLLTGLTTVLTLLGALGIAVVLAIGAWFSRWLVRPVDKLVDGAQRVADGDLKTPVVARARRDRDWTQTEELDFLMGSFEEMRQSIVDRDEQMQMMLAGIAHEVRNPLGGMELFCGLLREDLESQREDNRQAQLEKVDRIERELQYLDDVVESFLRFARPGEIDVRRIDAAGLIEEVAELAAPKLEASGCTLDVDVEEGLELTVDPGQLRRALINVIGNACQASSDSRSVVEVRCRADETRRRIEVIDSGHGIADEQIEQMCRPFFTTREQGSGLGLALTLQIIECHDGRFEIESAVGVGTTVRFLLPFDDDVETRDKSAGRRKDQSREVPQGWLG